MTNNQPMCINLREQFGWRYKIAYEESYYAEYGQGSKREDPWLQVMPCKFGEISVGGSELLTANVCGHPRIAARLRRLACCTVRQNGDFGELIVSCHVDDFEQVAKIMQAKKRRRLSPEQREKCSQHLAKIRPQVLRKEQFTELEERKAA